MTPVQRGIAVMVACAGMAEDHPVRRALLSDALEELWQAIQADEVGRKRAALPRFPLERVAEERVAEAGEEAAMRAYLQGR